MTLSFLLIKYLPRQTAIINLYQWNSTHKPIVLLSRVIWKVGLFLNTIYSLCTEERHSLQTISCLDHAKVLKYSTSYPHAPNLSSLHAKVPSKASLVSQSWEHLRLVHDIFINFFPFSFTFPFKRIRTWKNFPSFMVN